MCLHTLQYNLYRLYRHRPPCDAMCCGGWALTFRRNWLPPCALKGKAADPSETLANIQAYYNFVTVNWKLFIFTPYELGGLLC